MKKLMIAAAAIAAVTGAYATEGCCGVDPTTTEECKANVYKVKMTLKTLVPKTIKKSGCEGLYFEQGTRTIDGYIWTCCDPCGVKAGVSPTDVQSYQITLWEKAAKTGILNGVGAGVISGEYTVTVKYELSGVKYTKVLEGTYAQADVAQAAQDFVNLIPGANLEDVVATPVADVTGHWADTDLESSVFGNTETALCRFSKTANKVAVQFEVEGTGTPDSEADATMYKLAAAGFGSFDKKSLAIKSVSGNVVGTLPSLDHCGDYAEVADLCDDFETWCDPDYSNGVEMMVPAFGTWTAKYVKKMGTLRSSVPVYNRQ